MSDLIKQRLTEQPQSSGFDTRPAPTPSPTPKKGTFRQQLLDGFGMSGKVALDLFEKGSHGVKFYIDKDGTPVAEPTKSTEFSFDGKAISREQALKILDME